MNQQTSALTPELESILHDFEDRSGLEGVDYEIKHGATLVLRLANPTERFYRILQDAKAKISSDLEPTPTIQRRTPANRLQTPEAKYLLRTLGESLNISRLSFKEDFFARYTQSVSNAEAQITAAANHIVYGRRGAGKSSLLLYAMRRREMQGRASAWLDMQVYQKRSDNGVVVDVMSELLRQLASSVGQQATSSVQGGLEHLRKDENLDDAKIRQFLPEMRQLFASVGQRPGGLFIFLDDFHILDLSIQPKLLGFLYSMSRGTSVFLKLSAIETLTKAWDPNNHTGLQVPHDAQTIKLDYNLTTPDKAMSHIAGILDTHAVYCGLPSVRFLCTTEDVLSRLVWVSAGVPRDALNMFAQAMTKGVSSGRNRVSVTNVNMAASEMLSQKMRELEIDVQTPETESDLSSVLERVREFCIKEQRKNAFLTEIRNDNQLYRQILKLADLRLVHVISEGITVGEAGTKYLGLILDYGFYTGVRAAQSVDLFNRQTERVAYKDLRKLPVLKE